MSDQQDSDGLDAVRGTAAGCSFMVVILLCIGAVIAAINCVGCAAHRGPVAPPAVEYVQ